MDFLLVFLIVLIFFVLIKPFRYLLSFFMSKEVITAKKLAALVGLALLCLVLIAGIDLLTIEPHVVSGNGNPALLLIIPFFMVLTIYLTALFFFFKDVMNGRVKLLVSLILPLIILYSLSRIWSDSSELISMLGGGPDEPESRIYRFPWLNQYTNTIFFNIYLMVFLSGITVWGSAIFSARRSAADEEESL
ncbi:hypothetical protein [Mesobacillus subterraneus]|uniref:Uncharacterized protein n=1 Tax=Mesobacillus subterraneus TaxID=285983 RepID=A0A427TSK0_9BACI|nr:hypothetical protein [Mesobacillus subterraneus]RSD27414.1 hypothetical protein EJA10_10050 [Mesobacillus subterraneus]